jgi:hypothetical protein
MALANIFSIDKILTGSQVSNKRGWRLTWLEVGLGVQPVWLVYRGSISGM